MLFQVGILSLNIYLSPLDKPQIFYNIYMFDSEILRKFGKKCVVSDLIIILLLIKFWHQNLWNKAFQVNRTRFKKCVL